MCLTFLIALSHVVHPILLPLAVAVALLLNMLWYYVKFCLRRKGKEVSWFGDHFRDYRLLREAITEAETETERQRFERLLLAMYCLREDERLESVYETHQVAIVKALQKILDRT